MWAMSTGHCCTQAPQVVQLHRTSGFITPPDVCAQGSPSPSATSCRSAIPRTSSWRLERWSAAARNQGAAAWDCSRRARVNSLGLSGFSVFQAGHWLWHRPHSVHVLTSSNAFHVKSPIAPTPRDASSSRSSMFSKSMASPLTAMGCRGPSAGRPSALRWNHTLKNAKKRCQATPIVGCAATVINQARDTAILMNATMAMPVSRVTSGVWASPDPIHAVKGKCTALAHDAP